MILLSLQVLLGAAMLFLIFGIIDVVAFFFIIFMVPETKGTNPFLIFGIIDVVAFFFIIFMVPETKGTNPFCIF